MADLATKDGLINNLKVVQNKPAICLLSISLAFGMQIILEGFFHHWECIWWSCCVFSSVFTCPMCPICVKSVKIFTGGASHFCMLWVYKFLNQRFTSWTYLLLIRGSDMQKWPNKYFLTNLCSVRYLAGNTLILWQTDRQPGFHFHWHFVRNTYSHNTGL